LLFLALARARAFSLTDEEDLMQMARQPKKKLEKKSAAGGKGGGVALGDNLPMPWGAGNNKKVCSDGRKAIAGFVLASDAIQPKKLFPPPKVPDDFIPLHRFNEILSSSSSSAAGAARSRGGARGPPAPAPRQIADLDVDQLLALAKGKSVKDSQPSAVKFFCIVLSVAG